HESEGLSSKHLVVRRGRPFKITLFFKDEPFSPLMDSLVFSAQLGELYVQFPLTFSRHVSAFKWGGQILSENSWSQSLRVLIFTPPNAPLGLYNLQLHIKSQAQQHSYALGNLILLFNPWSWRPWSDEVHLSHADQREEYVKNDSGILFMGTPDNLLPRTWEFGQYEEGILETCLKILDMSPQHSKNSQKDNLCRSNAVYLSRVVCAMINCEDDRGVLKGNWSGDFSRGVSPSQWTGSADILKCWERSQCRPVLYGQCWVFAAVMCTVMRALGIPSRVVTNFNSAHDTNANLIIEEFYSETGEKLQLSKESIWNYHVWLECWMSRPDIGSEFSGWQVLDPTPQEKSGGIFCCGPCPVKAIREKRVDLFYDVPFVYAEVNASVYTAIVKNNQVVHQSLDANRVGSLVCTKGVNSYLAQDLTAYYKNPHKTPRRNSSLHEEARSMSVSLQLDKVPVAGQSISFSVTVVNNCGTSRRLKEHINAQMKEYSHNLLETFWEASNMIKLGPYEGKSLTIEHWIDPSQYEQVLRDDGLVNLAVVIKDEVTLERKLASEEFNITMPWISIQVEDESNIVVNKAHSAILVFHNPFWVPIDGVLTVCGSGLIQGKVQSKVYQLQPGEKREQAVNFIPQMPGTKVLQASLEFKDSPLVLRGFKSVLVRAT
uniref:protein-glutamine gamma-glutamyltransferase n=1 Tax=Scleropages formosus TaxID=113540 RepID=A0A8C9S6M1_SCLFO